MNTQAVIEGMSFQAIPEVSRRRAHCPICNRPYRVYPVINSRICFSEFDVRDAVASPLNKPVECCDLAWYCWEDNFLGRNWLFLGVSANEQKLSF